jgi:hypothetical protein
MPLECEMFPDRIEARERSLCGFRIAKVAHTSRAFTRRLTTVLCAIVQSGCRFDEHVLQVRKF